MSPRTHGVTPVWGFGTVVASTHLAIRAGERIYGYLAPTRFLALPVSAVNPYVFTVSRPHFPEGTCRRRVRIVSSFTNFRQETVQYNH